MSNVVDVVIVSYRSGPVLERCLVTVERELDTTRFRNGQIVVVDNHDEPSVRELCSRHDATWIAAGTNLGFGAAANRGVAATSAPYVLVLNPDTEIEPGAVAAMADALDAQPDLGLVGPLMVTLDGQHYPSARAFPSLVNAAGHALVGVIRPDNRWTRGYRFPAEPDWLAGTAVLVRRDAFEAVGGFDEDYFMYVEDADLCWRLRRAGWKVRQVETATVRHAIGTSTERHPHRMIAAHHLSLWRFACRYERGWRRALLPAVALGLVFRAAAVEAGRLVRRRPPAAL